MPFRMLRSSVISKQLLLSIKVNRTLTVFFDQKRNAMPLIPNAWFYGAVSGICTILESAEVCTELACNFKEPYIEQPLRGYREKTAMFSRRCGLASKFISVSGH